MKSNQTIIFALSSLILLSSFSLLKNEPKSIIPFQKGKVTLSDSAKKRLDFYLPQIKKIDSLKTGYVMLTNFTCDKETSKYLNVSFIRAKSIIDYYSSKYKIARTVFHYVDRQNLDAYPPSMCDYFGKPSHAYAFGISLIIRP